VSSLLQPISNPSMESIRSINALEPDAYHRLGGERLECGVAQAEQLLQDDLVVLSDGWRRGPTPSIDTAESKWDGRDLMLTDNRVIQPFEVATRDHLRVLGTEPGVVKR